MKDLFEVTGQVRITKYKAGTKEVLWQSPWMDNMVVCNSNRGRNLVVQRLVGVNTYTLNILYGEMGTSPAAPANSDTILGTPTVRVVTALASVGVSLNEAQLQFFFTDTQLPDGTYYEFGTFVDGNVGTSTGQLFNHILFSTPYLKAAGEDTTVEVDFTVT
jgi:hypothetical protein